MSSERGQASVEWIGLLLLVALTLAAALTFVPAVDGLADGVALRHAYGERDAALVRANAPNLVYEPGTLTLPVDYRRCRSHDCSDAPGDPELDVHRTRRGVEATAFTHVVHRGGNTYLQYWLYYPDSPSTFMGSHAILKTLGIHDPAFHPDDWEGYQVRIGAGGAKSVRATKHGGYTWCKGHIWHNACERWGNPNGWTRISRGSHAGHIPATTPGTGLHERSTMAPGIELVPLETLDHDTYKPLKGGINPPWTKEVYVNPAADSS
jgi:hypothetical protein